ncbi:MAG: DUF4173 domain-containing protein, partial [Chitinophagaceae bacterium]|nr:DUF4173 domain-containing protein [Anaerolineae bacterium]
GLMLVMLFSASRRMFLYEEAFGFTHLRVYVHVSIVWLAVTFAIVALSLIRIRRNIFSLGLLLVAIGFLVTMNLMNADLYIAQHNIARYENGAQLDTCYLQTLSVDALPAVVALYETAENPDLKDQLGGWLVYHRNLLSRAQDDPSVFGFNLAREVAWDQLDDLALTEDSIPPSYRVCSVFGR